MSIRGEMAAEMQKHRWCEAGGDDHPYGAWVGGSKASGGRMAGGGGAGETDDQFKSRISKEVGLDDAKAAYAKQPTKANEKALESARQKAQTAWWSRGAAKDPNTLVDHAKVLAQAKSIKPPSLGEVKARIPGVGGKSDTKVTWHNKPKPVVAGGKYETKANPATPLVTGSIMVAPAGYKPHTMDVTKRFNGDLTVGNPGNPEMSYFFDKA